MKQQLLLIVACAAISPARAQDTLRNFNPQTTSPVVLQYSGIHSGYYTGHNSLFDEEWAEKYYISGNNQVSGLIAYHAGNNGSYSGNVEYKVYAVGSNGLPGTALATKPVSGGALDISGAPVYTQFDNPVNVKDSFFVSFNLGDYAHHNPGTKKIALKQAPDGSRTAADTLRYGRNAIRWHSHGSALWKDFFKENKKPVLTHFAIFPVVTLKTTSVSDFVSNGQLKMHAVFPNPALDRIQMKISTASITVLNCKILSMDGKIMRQWREEAGIGEKQLHADIAELSQGQYIFLIGSSHGTIAQTFIKH